jgi:hypothetical protein
MHIPVPRHGRAYRDIVLGVKVNDLQLANIEAIVVSVDQAVKGKVLFTCEVYDALVTSSCAIIIGHQLTYLPHIVLYGVL